MTVIVYVTRTGNSRTLALELGGILGSPVHEVVDKTDRRGPLRYLLGGAQASTKMATPIGDPQIDLAGVTRVVLVQPIWASNLCPPLRTWIQNHHQELAGVKLALVSSQLGSPPGGFFANVEAEFGKLEAFTSIRQGLSSEEKTAQLQAFAKLLGATGT